jgi:hypothetical protein
MIGERGREQAIHNLVEVTIGLTDLLLHHLHLAVMMITQRVTTGLGAAAQSASQVPNAEDSHVLVVDPTHGSMEQPLAVSQVLKVSVCARRMKKLPIFWRSRFWCFYYSLS